MTYERRTVGHSCPSGQKTQSRFSSVKSNYATVVTRPRLREKFRKGVRLSREGSRATIFTKTVPIPDTRFEWSYHRVDLLNVICVQSFVTKLGTSVSEVPEIIFKGSLSFYVFLSLFGDID